MISHVPLFTHPNPKKVLIIGGGDGGTLREVLRHPEVEKAVMIELDEQVVKVCKEYLPTIACEIDNPRAEIKFEDGVKFVKNTKEKFDVVIVDCSDPVGPSEALFGPDFQKDVFNVLNDDGIYVQQTDSPLLKLDYIAGVHNNLGKIFPKHYLYMSYIYTYPGGMWSFSFSSKKYHPLNDYDIDRFRNRKFNLKYYNNDIHFSCFGLPSFVKERIKSANEE